jgi:hypothetical protein
MGTFLFIAEAAIPASGILRKYLRFKSAAISAIESSKGIEMKLRRNAFIFKISDWVNGEIQGFQRQ